MEKVALVGGGRELNMVLGKGKVRVEVVKGEE